MTRNRSQPAIALGLLALGCLIAGCETTTTSKGFSSGYNYRKPGRMTNNNPRPAESTNTDSLAHAGDPKPSGNEIQLPDAVQAAGKGLGDLFELITPPPPGASSKQDSINQGMIPNNYTGKQELKDKNGNTVVVHFDRGRIIKKEVIPQGSDKPVSDAPKVYRAEQNR